MDNLRRKEHHTSAMTAEAESPAVGVEPRYFVWAFGHGRTPCRPDDYLLTGPPILPAVFSERLGGPW